MCQRSEGGRYHFLVSRSEWRNALESRYPQEYAIIEEELLKTGKTCEDLIASQTLEETYKNQLIELTKRALQEG